MEVAVGFGAAVVRLKPRRARPLLAGHPWVLDSAVDRIDGDVADGDVVEVVDHRGRFIARGLVNRHSRIQVRLYSWLRDIAIDRDFWERRLKSAIQLRHRLGLIRDDSAERIVYSEADGLSGLIVDRYAQHLVVQFGSLGIARRWSEIHDILRQLLDFESITVKADAGVAQLEGMSHELELHSGSRPEAPIVIAEHGIQFAVDVVAGQKTGFYLDQRENRRAAAQWCRDQRVLDLFCYTGGFSLTAATLGKAREVIGIDSSERAIDTARENTRLNDVQNVTFEQQECFSAVDQRVAAGERFGVVILDPPKFTRSRHSIDSALQAYHRLNRMAVELLDQGGILVTCCCSGNITREDFRDVLAGVAQRSRRHLQVIDQRGAAADHPISATCPETEYLKCFIVRVG